MECKRLQQSFQVFVAVCKIVKIHSLCLQVNTSFSSREPETANTFSNLAEPIWQSNISQAVFALEGKRRGKLIKRAKLGKWYLLTFWVGQRVCVEAEPNIVCN